MKKTSKHFLFLILILSFAAALWGCTPKNMPYTKNLTAFDTLIQLTVYSEKDAACLEEAAELCVMYDSLFSRTKEGSDVYRVNHANGAPVTVSEETIAVLEEALSYCEASGGLLDITIAPVKEQWDFSNPDFPPSALPDAEVLRSCASHVDYRNVLLDKEHLTVTLTDPEAQIDLGCIAKGYIADRLKDYMLENGVSSALINLGGNVLAVGKKQNNDPFTIGIKDPADTTKLISQVRISDSSVVTSGTYERYFIFEGERYHHILDPATGYPAKTDLSSATILSKTSAKGDALSTLCILLGSDRAKEMLDQTKDIGYILVKTDGTVISNQ
ncbi:MAG: FAD:protein FMN transferase [Lachnospiraceae bacterium]|nr:FAD:protein FMN transferase [Lachnospiraceae bacterium]